MRIRTKLAALVAVPLLLLGGVAAMGFRSQSVNIDNAEDATAAVRRNAAVDLAVIAVGNERMALLTPSRSPRHLLRAETDSALQSLSAAVRPGDEQETVTTALAAVAAGRRGEAPTTAYGEAIDTLFTLEITSADDYPTAATYRTAVMGRLALGALAAREAAWIDYLDAPEPTSETAVVLAGGFSDADSMFELLVTLSAGGPAPAIDEVVRNSATRQLAALEAAAVDDLGELTISVDGERAGVALGEHRAVWTDAVLAQGAAIDLLVTSHLDDANAARSFATLLGLVGVVVMGALAIVVQRSIIVPFEVLEARTDAIARTEIPALTDRLRLHGDATALPQATPIPVTSADEIGRLANAFNVVQLAAHSSIRDQAIGRRNMADMFVNLGRRNQQLLNRSAGRMTHLVDTENDPDRRRQLAEIGSAITHLRRHAESLVALAGAPTLRPWSAAVPMAEVVAGAVAQVEAADRIDVGALDSVEILGKAASDLTHLLVELLENASAYSEPSTSVTVTGHRHHDDYQLTIIDKGIGMSQADLAEYNRRITDPPPLERVPTRFLGLYVVGRLAARHRLSVRLSESPSHGIMARIEVPAGLLTFHQVPNEDEPRSPLAEHDDEHEAPSPLAERDDEHNADCEPRSPLEEVHDLDAELATMLGAPDGDGTDQVSAATSVGADGALPIRQPGATAPTTATDPGAAAQPAVTDNSEQSADYFSTMMSAISGGGERRRATDPDRRASIDGSSDGWSDGSSDGDDPHDEARS
ncbi:MAG: ATP-binding protein [Actinomycetota bacterium]